MIDKIVDIEQHIDIQNICIIDLPVDRRIRREPGEEMCPTNDGVEMDDTHVTHPLMGGFWLYNPQASGGVRFITCRVPTHECAWVVNALV